jgi:hypothetical protein
MKTKEELEFELANAKNRINEIKKELAASTLCNLCGLYCSLNDGDSRGEAYGLLHQRVMGGYCSTPGNGSGALDDLTTYSFSLCEFCLDWIFEQCVVPPKVFPMHMDQEPYRPAAQRVAEDEWRKMKDHFAKEKQKRDDARAAKKAK